MATRRDALLDATQTGEWEWDFATGEISWSPTLGPLHGKPRGWVPDDYEEWASLIHPEDRPAVTDETFGWNQESLQNPDHARAGQRGC